jgi:hypothetical protein
MKRGLLVGAIQLALLLSIGGKLLYDRATLPRGWVKTAPYDPNLPIRGRYVRLRVEPEFPTGIGVSGRVRLEVRDGRVVAHPSDDATDVPAHVMGVTTLAAPVAFFIPEHVPDPSIRPAGERLWVEVTVPRRGPPRPIRLGVQRGDGPIEPLPLD